MPRPTTRRAGTVALTSFATLTLVPLLAPARPAERVLLLLAALPAAALFGYLAGYTADTAVGSAPRLEAAQHDVEQRLEQLRVARRAAATTQPPPPVTTPVSEPAPGPGTGSPIGGGHLVALARPPADRHPTR